MRHGAAGVPRQSGGKPEGGRCSLYSLTPRHNGTRMRDENNGGRLYTYEPIQYGPTFPARALLLVPVLLPGGNGRVFFVMPLLPPFISVLARIRPLAVPPTLHPSRRISVHLPLSAHLSPPFFGRCISPASYCALFTEFFSPRPPCLAQAGPRARARVLAIPFGGDVGRTGRASFHDRASLVRLLDTVLLDGWNARWLFHFLRSSVDQREIENCK